MSRDIKDADPTLQVAYALIKEKYEKMFPARTLILTETHRTVERQQELYAQGRTTSGPIVTKVDGVVVKGKHNYMPSRAIDVAVQTGGVLTWNEKYYKPLGGIIATVSSEIKKPLTWGGNWKSFKDLPHIEI